MGSKYVKVMAVKITVTSVMETAVQVQGEDQLSIDAALREAEQAIRAVYPDAAAVKVEGGAIFIKKVYTEDDQEGT